MSDITQEHPNSGQWVDCPHCQGKLLIQMKSRVVAVEVASADSKSTAPDTPKDRASRWKAGLTGNQLSILDQAEKNGLMGSFVVALSRSSHEGMPTNPEKLFLDWLKLAKSRLIPAWAVAEFKALYPGKFVEFFGSGFIGAVVANDKIELFLPMNLIKGQRVNTATDGVKSIGDPGPAELRNWIKTKMGYVPASASAMINEMKRRSYGEFARPSL